MKTFIDGPILSYEEAVAGALANKVNFLVELTAAGKIQLAENGIALGPIREQMAPGDAMRPVRKLGAGGTVKLIQSGAIAPGARVILDTANPGKVKALPTGTPGIYRSLGIKDSAAEYGTANGAAGDVITVADQVETVIVATAVAMSPADGVFAGLNSTAVNPTKADFDALLAQCEILRDTVAGLRAAAAAAGIVS